MELLSIEDIDFDKQELKAVFDGLFEGGFYVESNYDFDKIQDEFFEEETNSKDYFLPEAITFWDWKVFNSDEEPISINNRESKKIKQLVENELIDVLTKEIND
jgi:hypothetical protein